MTAISPAGERAKVSFWGVCFAFTGIHTLFWLYPALTDWLWRASSGQYGSFPDLEQYGFLDMAAMLLLKHHMWLLLAMVVLNVLATVTCLLAVRRRAFKFPLCAYVAGFVAVGVAILFCDVRLYGMRLSIGGEAFTMTLMWCILAAPLWMLTAKGIFNLLSKRPDNNPLGATA